MKGSEAKALAGLERKSNYELQEEARDLKLRLATHDGRQRSVHTRVRRLLTVARKREVPVAVMSAVEHEELQRTLNLKREYSQLLDQREDEERKILDAVHLEWVRQQQDARYSRW